MYPRMLFLHMHKYLDPLAEIVWIFLENNTTVVLPTCCLVVSTCKDIMLMIIELNDDGNYDYHDY